MVYGSLFYSIAEVAFLSLNMEYILCAVGTTRGYGMSNSCIRCTRVILHCLHFQNTKATHELNSVCNTLYFGPRAVGHAVENVSVCGQHFGRNIYYPCTEDDAYASSKVSNCLRPFV